MNRVDFMQQLESLLQSIAPMERDEALQYYNDYFDDAGKENEQEVIGALGNPARVAENIRRDLLNSGYGEGTMRKALASDRALVEYGKETQDETSEQSDDETKRNISESSVDAAAGNVGFGNGENAAAQGAFGSAMAGGEAFGNPTTESGTSGNTAAGNGSFGNVAVDFGNTAAGSGGFGNAAAPNSSYGNTASQSTVYGNAATQSNHAGSETYGSQQVWATSQQDQGKAGKTGKSGMPGWEIALIVALVVFTSPVWLGLIGAALGVVGALLGVIAAWFAVIVAFGVVAVCMLVVVIVLVVVGFMCMFTNPWVGLAMIGSGLVCGGIGILFLMATVAMAGIVTPAMFRGIGSLFRCLTKKSERSLQRG